MDNYGNYFEDSLKYSDESSLTTTKLNEINHETSHTAPQTRFECELYESNRNYIHWRAQWDLELIQTEPGPKAAGTKADDGGKYTEPRTKGSNVPKTE